MEQLEHLLPVSSQTAPTPTNDSPLDSIKPPLPASSNPKIGITIRTNSYPPTSLRLATILALLLLSVWANYEASKGFDLTILNASTHTLSGRQFELLFVSNGKAAEMALQSSGFIEHILYPNHEGEAFVRKPVHHVTIRLSDHSITNDVLVTHHDNHELSSREDYLIEISRNVMARKEDITIAVASALHRGLAYVWLWDGCGSVPRLIIDAMVEYLLVQYNLPPKHYESTNLTSTVADLLQLCEERSNGFVARLNNAVRENYCNEHAVTDAFSSPSEIMCLSRIISTSEDGAFVDNAVLNLELNQPI